MNAELSTSYAEWKKAYDDHKWARDEANMKEILVGWCEEDQRIHVCFEVESMEVMQKFMETHAEVIASSGFHKFFFGFKNKFLVSPDSTIMPSFIIIILSRS